MNCSREAKDSIVKTMTYEDEGISQIVVYRSHPDGEAELMYEFIPEK